MSYDCRKRPDENRIDCKFVQTSIRKKAKPEDLPKRLNEAKKQFPEYLKEMEKPERCQQISELLAMIQGQIELKMHPKDLLKKHHLSPAWVLSEMIKRYKISGDEFGPLEALAEFCKTKDERAFLR